MKQGRIIPPVLSHVLVAVVCLSFSSLQLSWRSTLCLSPEPVVDTVIPKPVVPTVMTKDATKRGGNVDCNITVPESPKVEKTVKKEFLPSTISNLVSGMGRVTRKDFTQKYDLRVPIVPDIKGQEDMIMLYTSENSLPTKKASSLSENGNLPLYSVEEATENCAILKIVPMGPTWQRQQRACLALMPQIDSYQISKWVRKQKGQDLLPVGRLDNKFFVAEPPKPTLIKAGLQLLKDYLSVYNDVLESLSPVAKEVAGDGNTIVVMVTNFGHAGMLLNYVCAARARVVDISKVLLFAMDEKTKKLADSLGVTSFYHEDLFSFVPEEAAPSDSSVLFSKAVMGKVYPMHLINALGYDFLFQDVDVVPYAPQGNNSYLEYFVDRAQREPFDMWFQYDHTKEHIRAAPWYINSGFFFARHNARTEFLFSEIVRKVDSVLLRRDDQVVLSDLIIEHASYYNLQVKTLYEDKDLFLNGAYFYENDKHGFMQNVIEGKVATPPFIFHNNKNKNKNEKVQVFQQVGNWFVTDSLTDNALTNVLQSAKNRTEQVNAFCHDPIAQCHFKDKPSAVPCD